MLYLASLGGVLFSLLHEMGGVLSHVSHAVHALCDTPVWFPPA
ncbi:MAG TPA: hypothetical protein VEJ20_01255 [Candidatus Eremiobacteraceae bacterium]|nr:hypothetical protein [Candidatus Eremiobacteraceae bacterium]